MGPFGEIKSITLKNGYAIVSFDFGLLKLNVEQYIMLCFGLNINFGANFELI